MDVMNALRITAVALLIFLIPTAYSDQLTGKVVGISDGDTITILTEHNENIKGKRSPNHTLSPQSVLI
jgi:hypothetical protein